MPADVESFWLKINYFFLSNRDDLKKWWVILLIAADVFFVVFLFTNTIVYLLGMPKQNEYVVSMINSPIDYEAIREANAPSNLQIVTSTAVPKGEGLYDLVTQVKNPNKNWVVETVQYKYIINGDETDVFTDYIMPNSDKYLTILSKDLESDQQTINVSMEILDIDWQRVPDTDKLVNIDFSIEDIEYSSLASFGGTLIHNVEASITNNTFKGFWETRFIVVLYNGDDIVGVNYVYFDQFKAGATNNLKAQWSYLPGRAGEIVILPDMDLTDTDNII